MRCLGVLPQSGHAFDGSGTVPAKCRGIQTLIGLAIAVLLEFFNAEDFFQRCLRFEGANGMGLALAICALVSQFVMLPAMNDLVKAREEQKVGQPIHHPAPNELATEDSTHINEVFMLYTFLYLDLQKGANGDP